MYIHIITYCKTDNIDTLIHTNTAIYYLTNNNGVTEIYMGYSYNEQHIHSMSQKEHKGIGREEMYFFDKTKERVIFLAIF